MESDYGDSWDQLSLITNQLLWFKKQVMPAVKLSHVIKMELVESDWECWALTLEPRRRWPQSAAYAPVCAGISRGVFYGAWLPRRSSRGCNKALMRLLFPWWQPFRELRQRSSSPPTSSAEQLRGSQAVCSPEDQSAKLASGLTPTSLLPSKVSV